MSLIGLVGTILVVFVATALLLWSANWIIDKFIPTAASLKSAMNTIVIVLVVVVVVIYCLNAVGLMPNLGTVRVPRAN